MDSRGIVEGKLVFVTGGTGFLGRHLVPLLVAEGFKVRLLVRPTSEFDRLPTEGVELVYGDVTDPQVVADGICGCHYVIHAAGHFRFWGPEEIFEEVNVSGTRFVVGAAMAHGVERMVHVSTIVVIGDPRPGEVLDEETICRPQDNYQKSKYKAEGYAKRMAKEMGAPIVILRPGAYYGPYGEYAFNRLFVYEPMIGWKVKVEGGTRLTFPVYVPDVARAILCALTHGREGEVYNISDSSITHNDLNDMVSEMLGISRWRINVPSWLMILFAAVQEGLAKITRREPFYPLNLRHYVFHDWNINSDKARDELGFEPTSIQEGLKATIEWYKDMKGKR